MSISGFAVATVISSGLVRLIATVPVFIMHVMFDKDIASAAARALKPMPFTIVPSSSAKTAFISKMVHSMDRLKRLLLVPGKCD